MKISFGHKSHESGVFVKSTEILKGDTLFESEKRGLAILETIGKNYHNRMSIHPLSLIHFVCFMELLGYVHIGKSLEKFLMEIWNTS